MDSRWSSVGTIVPNFPMVVSETLDGEAIIMHHGSGHYFNALGCGAVIWEAIEQGATLDGLAARLGAACGIAHAEAVAAVTRFLGTLGNHDLIKPGDQPPGSVAAPRSLVFEEPELGVHMDLADMLLLDPVHDVDEAGWPAPNRTAAGGAEAWSG